MTYAPEKIVNFPDDPNREISKIADAFKNLADANEAMSSRLRELESRPVPVPPLPSANILWQWDARSIAPFFVHSKPFPDRVTLVTVGGRPAVRLLTNPGDTNVNGSGAHERTDLRLGNDISFAREGLKIRFKHGIWFPADFVDLPPSPASAQPWYWGSAMNWHDDADDGRSQGPLQLMFAPPTATDSGRPTGLHFQCYGGVDNVKKGEFPIEAIRRERWYDFEFDIGWTSGPTGFCTGRVNGRQFMAYKGPTLHAGHGAYLKLANYHTAFGQATAILHGAITVETLA